MKPTTKVAVIVSTLVLIALDVWASATSHHGWYTPAALTVAICCGVVYVVAGIVGAERRPQSRVGPLLCVAGLLFLVGLLNQSSNAWLFTIGEPSYWIALAVIGHIIVTFPSGRIRAWTEASLVFLYYANAIVLTIASMLFFDPRAAFGCAICPRNLLMVSSDPALSDRIGDLATLLGVATAIVAVGVLSFRWWNASSAGRRIYGPALWVGFILSVEYVLVVGFFPDWLSPSSRFFYVDQVLTASYPLAFLLGLLRTRMSQRAVSDLVIELGRGSSPEGGLRDALARGLGDPTLRLAYFVEEAGGWIDEDGRSVELPSKQGGRAATTVEIEGIPIAALIHDEAVLDDPELVDTVVSAARLAVANDRLRARVQAQLELVRESRARVLEAADGERRRLERDLHDGAQQRLIWLSLLLGIAEEEIAAGDGVEGRRLLEEARTEAEASLSDLRNLARGIHPAILTNAGLEPAVRSLVNRSQIPVRLAPVPEGRFEPAVEATAYFVISEALANAAKHARAAEAAISIVRHNGDLIIDVSDDGVGGADAEGSGLRGLADRVAAVGGSISISSPDRGGTHVHMVLPCG